MHFFEQLSDLFKARFPLIVLNTVENQRVYRHLREFCKEADYSLFRWNCVEGMLDMGLGQGTELAVGDIISDPEQVLTEIQRRLDEREQELFVLEGLFEFIEFASVKVLLNKLTTDLPKSLGAKHVVLLNPGIAVPSDLARLLPTLDVPLPSEEELAHMLEVVAQKYQATLAEEARRVIAAEAVGMTEKEAQLAFQLVAVRSGFGIGATEVVREAKSWIQSK
ncbi:MAG: hypothetical protein AAGN35_01035 [Bacteroidota bacterium]